MPKTEDFATLLSKCIPEGTSEERWCILKGLAIRTMRRAKRREVTLQDGTLELWAKAMVKLGGKLPDRIERLRRATLPPSGARRRQ